MKIYKYGGFLLLLCVLLVCISLYFDAFYNEQSIEVELKHPLKKEVFSQMIDDTMPIYELRFQKDHGAYQLIMTTGSSQFFDNQVLYSGVKVHETIKKGIVLGDEIVGQTFRHLDVLGEKYDFLGETYTIIGIEKASNNIYIPYREDLISNEWYRIEVKFHIRDIDLMPAKTEYIRTQILLHGGQIRTFVVNYEYPLFFKNMAYVILVVWLGFYLKYWFMKWIQTLRIWRDYYKDQKMRKELWTLIKIQRKTLFILFLRMMMMMGIIILGYYMVQEIHIPKRLIANNIMSVKSWYHLGTYYFEQLMLSVKYGFFNIRRDFIVMVGGVIFLFTHLSHTFEQIGKVKNEK